MTEHDFTAEELTEHVSTVFDSLRDLWEVLTGEGRYEFQCTLMAMDDPQVVKLLASPSSLTLISTVGDSVVTVTMAGYGMVTLPDEDQEAA